jgi:large subunit ribosomal protein L24
MARANVKKDAEVMVISGANRKKSGAVLKVDVTRGLVWVKGVNVGKKAVRRSQANPQGGFKEVERPINISNVMPLERWNARQAKKPAAVKG